jgi:hypothetical protein
LLIFATLRLFFQTISGHTAFKAVRWSMAQSRQINNSNLVCQSKKRRIRRYYVYYPAMICPTFRPTLFLSSILSLPFIFKPIFFLRDVFDFVTKQIAQIFETAFAKAWNRLYLLSTYGQILIWIKVVVKMAVNVCFCMWCR